MAQHSSSHNASLEDAFEDNLENTLEKKRRQSLPPDNARYAKLPRNTSENQYNTLEIQYICYGTPQPSKEKVNIHLEVIMVNESAIEFQVSHSRAPYNISAICVEKTFWITFDNFQECLNLFGFNCTLKRKHLKSIISCHRSLVIPSDDPLIIRLQLLPSKSALILLQ